MEVDRRLRFDDFSLDPSAAHLYCGEEVVPLTPKAFAVLSRLIEDTGRLVSKEELLRAGWAKTHVSEGVLKVVILEIRRALGDDPTAPRFIETVPRRGYRFIAPRARPPNPPASARGALVGREDVLAQLEERLTRAKAGRRQIVFLSGEAGIGKTAVLDRFVERAAADPDLLIASGACLEHYGEAEAYFPVLEGLGRLLREPGAERVIRVLKTHAPTWLMQLPWLQDRGDRDALAAGPFGVTKERMLREMAEAVETLTASTPLVLVLEDLHWSDYSTLDLLGMLARRQEAARLLLIGSYRSVDVIVKPHPLRALVQELRVRHQCEDIALQFLSEADVAAYLAQRFGASTFAAELAAAVHRRTDGNALFMVRLAEELVTLGVLVEQQGRWTVAKPLDEIDRMVPEGLRELIDRQIARLDPALQRVLEVAGVLGNQFAAGAVAAGLGEDAVVVEESCDLLSRQQQLVAPATLTVLPDGTPLAHYCFTHNLYPQVLDARVPAARRLRLHQRIGEWLEQTYGVQAATISTQLAWHFEKAGDYQRAIRYLVLAAENAVGRFAYGDAIRLLQHARSLVDRLTADARSKMEIELLQRIGDAHFGRGAMSECAEAYDAAATQAADAGLTAVQVDSLNSLVRPFCFIDPDRAMAAIAQAVHLSTDLNDPLLQARTQLLGAYVRLMFDTWRMKDCEICESASETIRRLSDAGLLPFDRVIYAHVQVLRADYAEALENVETGIPKGNESVSPVVYFLAFSGKTLALMMSGRLGELVQLLRAGREIAEKNGNETTLFIVREAWLRTAVLDFDGARQLCEAMTVPTANVNWHGQSRIISGIASGYAALERGKYDDASRSFAKALDPKADFEFFLHWYWRMNAQLGLSNVWLASGKLRQARLEADRFLESALSTAEPNLQALAWELQARVAMAEKDWKGAEEKIEQGLAVVQTVEIPTTAWRVHATRADLYRQEKKATAAEVHRARAEEIILALANSFAPDDPLRHTFLSAALIRRIRQGGARRPPR